MGRKSTGAMTTKECSRIELSFLLKEGFIKKNCSVKGTLSWDNGNTISIESQYFDSDKWIRLIYTNTNRITSERINYDYKIYLDTIPSNLGVREILYFICPDTDKRCRILYKTYGSHTWKSRQAYSKPIYYQLQVSSKYYRACDRYFILDKRIKNLKKNRNHIKSTYKGKRTSTSIYLEKLTSKRNYWNAKRWMIESMPIAAQKLFLKE